jgi:mannan endo-1,4-beta-mannosidase
VALAVSACTGGSASPPGQTSPGMPTASPPPSLSPALRSAFVTRQGDHLVLHGRTYRFIGLNMYAAGDREGCSLPAPLSAILPRYLKGKQGNFVLRAWANTPYDQPAGEPYDWTSLNKLVKLAGEYHVRLMLTLDNQWGACELGGTYKDAAWYGGGFRGQYLRWVTAIVTRYRNNPTIMAWQLMNEAEIETKPFSKVCASRANQLLLGFTSAMAKYVKELDPNHLLGLGTIGGGQCGASNADPQEYVRLHAVPGIDFCEVHDYPYRTHLDVALRIRQCRGLDKPLIVGEFGLKPQEVGGLAARAAQTQQYIQRIMQLGAAGVLVWGAQPDDYNIAPTDPLVRLLQQLGGDYRLETRRVSAGLRPLH